MTSEAEEIPNLAINPLLGKPSDANLIEFIEVLTSIDAMNPLARLNRSSISDNNGNRIEL